MWVKLYDSTAYFILYWYINMYIFRRMNNSLNCYQIKPTYAELSQEASIHPTEPIKYPCVKATQ